MLVQRDIELELFRFGRGAPILFLHPGPGFQPDEPWIALLAQAGYEIIVPSHPGFGKSALPDDFKTVDDLAYFYLDFIKAQGLSDVTLIGSSFGGWIASEMAVRSTRDLRAMILVDTLGCRFKDRDEVDIVDVFMMSDEEFAEAAYANPQAGLPRYGEYSEERLEAIARNRVGLAQFGWSPYMNNPRLKRWLHRIDVPTLLLWGERDRIVDLEYGRSFTSRIPGAELKVIQHAGHFPQIEQPELFVRSVSDFVEVSKVKIA